MKRREKRNIKKRGHFVLCRNVSYSFVFFSIFVGGFVGGIFGFTN